MKIGEIIILAVLWAMSLFLRGCNTATAVRAIDVATAQSQTTAAYIDAAQGGVVALKPHVMPTGEALRANVDTTLGKARASNSAETKALADAGRAATRLQDERDALYYSIPQRIWRFIRGMFGLLLIVLLIGVIANVVGAQLVGSWIGLALRWLAKTISAVLTLGVTAVWSTLRWLVEWIVGSFQKKRKGATV
jgi:hypothetical protein